ncbi:alpha-2-macroglobulin receptor-associated protein-like [Ptychodera flava]|uniref:alpha-2-macroglobulin receptor-associated protein-like n=1 Tax=Ptychodera flava TaxID=63121 RepID=UPI00396A491A
MFRLVSVVASIFIVVGFLSWVGQCNPKYTEDAQFAPKQPSEWEFRQRRANQVWEKAQRMGLSPQKLDNLKKDLRAHDEKAMKWKKMKRDGGDPDGEQEAAVRRELAEIMRRYGMAKEAAFEEKNLKMEGTGAKKFEDMRLNRLWHQASLNGQFSTAELEDLRQELQHHQDKVDEFRQLMDDLHGSDDINRVDKFKRMDVDEAEEAKDRKVRELELKIKHKELNSDYKRLEVKTRREHEQSGFHEPRLHQMWMDALKSNFTEDELQSLKEEMKHFEKKLAKHESIKEEAIKAELQYHKAKKSGEHHDPSYFESLKERARETANTVKKHLTDFTDRIAARRHTEL